jgi:FkbH-like protein
MQTPTIAITATFTADPLVEPLAFWMEELDLPLAPRIAPYNQIFQQLLDPGSLLSQNRAGVNVVVFRTEDLQREGGGLAGWTKDPAAVEARLERHLAELAQAITGAARATGTPHLVALCPPSDAALRHPARAAFLARAEERLHAALAGETSVYPLPSAELLALYPVAEPHDPHGDELGHIPYSAAFFTALATRIARAAYALWSAPRKVIAVDCDETLWKGVVGEVGPAGIEIDPPRRAVQELLVRQQQAGMVLCVTSKNVEQDVLEVWEARPEMPLRREHIVALRVGWQRKSESLRALSGELGLGLDSFIFLDDSPIECAEVEAALPEVLTVLLPQPKEAIPAFLEHVWAFDRLRVTDEDRRRTALYRENEERERVRRGSRSLSEFIDGLGLEVTIAPVAEAQVPRVAQLTQRTNQFNCTTRRRTEGEIQALRAEGPARVCLAVEVSDRFGDYGLVGLTIAEPRGSALDVDTFLLSCRVLGRTVENRMLRALGAIAEERGLQRVDLHFAPTKKNQPARDFLDAVGAVHKQAEGEREAFTVRLPAGEAAALPLTSLVAHLGDEGREEAARAPEDKADRAPAPSAQLGRIARELGEVGAIQAAIAAYRRRAPGDLSPIANADAAPILVSPVEAKIIAAWTEVLAIDGIGLEHDFFDLGGDSLTAAQVVARLRQAFEVQLPIDALFDARTVPELAVTILHALAERDEGASMESLLRELEGS